MRKPEFEAMIAPARLYPELWRLFLGILLVVFVYAGFSSILAVLLFVIGGPFNFGQWLTRLNPPDEPIAVIGVLLTAAAFVLATTLAAAACHFRGPGTLFGPRDETVRSFWIAVFVSAPFYGGLVVAGFFLGPTPVPNLPLETWIIWLPAAVVVILFQVSGEEMLFRGYLPQQLAARFTSRLIWMGLPALIFGLAHYNPAPGGVTWLVVFTTFVLGLIAMDLTERTGSLGAAIGLHFVNNATAILLVSTKDTLTGLALWVTPLGIDEMPFAAGSILINLVFLLVVWRAIRWAVER